MSVFEAVHGLALRLFEVRVYICLESGKMERRDHGNYLHNVLTKKIRPDPGRCPRKPSVACKEHVGEETAWWEPCMCCIHKQQVAGS